MFVVELNDVVTSAPTHVDEKHSVRARIRAADESFLNGVEVRVHPARLSVPRASHVMGKLLGHAWYGVEVLEEAQIGVIGFLKYGSGRLRILVSRQPCYV